MTELLSFTMNGLVLGLIFAVVALGFTLILGVMQVINFTHGILFAFGAYFAFSMQKFVGFWMALILAPILVGVVGLILERLVIHRTYGGNPLFGLLLTFGLATALEEVIRYGAVSPGDPVVRFVPPAPDVDTTPVENVSDLEGMIIELQADRPMTLVSQSNVVYLDRGREDGLKAGDLLDIHRHSAGLPPRKIGQLKVLSAEPHTAAAKVIKANTRVIKGDRFKLVGYASPLTQQVGAIPESPTTQASQAIPADLVASKLKVQDASGQSRLNLGDLAKFLHYDSGDAAIKPENYKVLDQLIEYLRTSGDTRMIRIEGHTDNVEIGPSLKSRYPSNWELSKVRANGVLRYLVEKGGVDSARVSAVGLGATKPTATNAVEEGRTRNRRVEVLLYAPKADTSEPIPEVQTQVQKVESNPSSLSARGSNDQPTSSTAGSDSTNSAVSGTLSVGAPSQIPAQDGSGTANTSDTRSSPSPDTSRQGTPTQQPAAGTPTE